MNEIPSQTELLPDAPEQSRQSPDRRLERRRRRTGRLLGLAAVSGLALLVGLGAYRHMQREAAAAATLTAEHDAVPVVRTVVLKAVDTPRDIELPGSTEAFDTATLYARATGYIAKRNVDIGSRVRAGAVLAVIAAPDLDQELAQARAQLVQLQANVLKAQADAKVAYDNAWRTAVTSRDGWTSQQQADVYRDTLEADNAALAVARANVLAQQAQVNRLVELTGFEKVVAPFDGVITSRHIDAGSLVTANDNSGTPLFTIERTDTLRVLIYVPQKDYFGMKDGDEADVTVPELPGRVFHGRLARNANALQPDTRTVLAEVDVDNRNGALAPGVYTIVHLHEPREYPVIVVPSQAIIFDDAGLQAAVYHNGALHLRRLNIAADNGATLEVRDGLHAGDRLILDPPIGATDGMRVTMAQQPGLLRRPQPTRSFTATNASGRPS
ncbi:MAG TPA: efflux RND transporter periplasmic adaptor subunit [Acetobacteraceae bacterium]|nr:efflux RND transporter periplasmic adaptor subunit [Acetobacteraceae bacterium]